MFVSKILLCLLVLNSSVSQRSRVPSLGLISSGNFLTAPIVPGYSPSYLRRNNRGRVKRRRQGDIIFSPDARTNDFNPTISKPIQDATVPLSFNWANSPIVLNRVNPANLNTVGPVSNGEELLFPNGQIPTSNTNGEEGNQPPVNDAPSENNQPNVVPRQDSTSPSTFPSAVGRKVFRTNQKPSCATEDNVPCENDDEYDQFMIDKMEEVLRRTQLNEILDNSIVSNLINDTKYSKEKGFPPDMITRIGGGNGFVSESPACSASESIIYPRRAKSSADDWVFVVNQNMVKQGVRVEKCVREGSRCEMGGQLPPTIKTVCRQKFIYRKLLVLTTEGTDIQPESVLIPSCCVCYVQRNHDLVIIRSGKNRTDTSNGPNPPNTPSTENPSMPRTDTNDIEPPNGGEKVNAAEKEAPKDQQNTTAEDQLQNAIPITFNAQQKQTATHKITNSKTEGANNSSASTVVFNRKMEDVIETNP